MKPIFGLGPKQQHLLLCTQVNLIPMMSRENKMRNSYKTREMKNSNLKFVNIFTPNLTGPEHTALGYFIYIFQIISDNVCFLQYIANMLVLVPSTKKNLNKWQLCLPHMLRSKPEEINPWSWRENLKPDLLSQRRGTVLTILAQQAQLHSDSIRHNHQLFPPAGRELLNLKYAGIEEHSRNETWSKKLLTR